MKRKIQEENAGRKLSGKFSLMVVMLMMALAFVLPGKVSAHCDGIDGPVIKAAQTALEQKNVDMVLIWVQKEDEDYIRKAFDKTLKLRTISKEAKELADTYFFETLVRVHRAGEGESYTGLKPAGRDLGPAIPATDKSIASGSPKEVWTLLSNSIHQELHEKFTKVEQLKNYDIHDVEKGREFVKAYVDYIHFAEKVYNLTRGAQHNTAQTAAHAH